MTSFSLSSKADILSQIVSFFAPGAQPKPAAGYFGPKAELQICEDIAFGENNWLTMGEIQLAPLRPSEGERSPEPPSIRELVAKAIVNGYYDWRIPNIETVHEQAVSLINKQKAQDVYGKKGSAKNPLTDAQQEMVRRSLESIPRIAVRCGLAKPVFDPNIVADLSQWTPRTVVVDTSAVHQGALDFLVNNFGYQTRFRVPSVVQMEIQTHVNNYFAYRREGTSSPQKAFASRVAGPGGQWVLLRVSMNNGSVIERPRSGVDPLRGIVSLEVDQEDRNLGIERLNRSYADRLIIETALHHQDNWPSRQMVAVLTGDEGLARMSLAEGLQPIFFRAVVPPYLFGSTLSGVYFKPFSVGNGVLGCTPLNQLVSECAAVFGRARLFRASEKAFVEARSIGEQCPWHPSHTSQGLLWSSSNYLECNRVELVELEVDQVELAAEGGAKKKGFARVSLAYLVDLLQALEKSKTLSDHAARDALSGLSESRFREIKRFMLSGEFVEESDKGMQLTRHGVAICGAIATADGEAMGKLLDRVPSYRHIREILNREGQIVPDDDTIPKSAFTGYCELAEATLIGVRIGGSGIYATGRKPPLREFSKEALVGYDKIRRPESDLVLAGEWLETMVMDYKIHPIVTRDLLYQAREARYLDMVTEGSTPDTSHERHVFVAIEREGKFAKVARCSVYDGSFLIPGRASPFMRLKGGKL